MKISNKKDFRLTAQSRQYFKSNVSKLPQGTLSKSGPLNYWQSDTTLDETVNAAELVSWFTGNKVD